MKKKRKTIIKKSIINIVILGVFIMAGVCAVASTVFYQTMVDVFYDVAYSFDSMIAYEVYDIDLKGIIQEDEDLTETLEAYRNHPETLSEEEKKLVQDWVRIYLFINSAVAQNTVLERAQIIVPSGEDVLCIWGAESDEKNDSGYVFHRPIREDETRVMEMIKQNDSSATESLSVYSDGNKMVGTAFWPIYDMDNLESQPLAFAEIDVSVTDIRTGIQQLMIYIALLVVGVLSVGMIIYFFRMKKNMISPILRLEMAASGVVDKLKEGGEPLKADIHTGDEIEALAQSFENMETNLHAYISENAAITAEKERLNTELKLAATIQADMLPSVFPPFPGRKEFDIFASMTPAKEVGGDFYDFFFVDDDILALVIADVSGKGVPASLFMMRTMIAIRNLAANDPSPASILTSLNGQISDNNKSGMFVTVWLGFLDLKSGLLRAVNAGHEYPLIRKPGENFEILKDKHGLVAGVKKNMKYKEYELQIVPGTKIFVYTDGLPEARNADKEMFRIGKALDALNRNPEGTPEELIVRMKESVFEFAGDAEQFDDMTMLCLDYFGPQGETEMKKEITVEACPDRIPVVKDFLREGLKAADCPEKTAKRILIAAEELYSNIAMYAYAGSDAGSGAEGGDPAGTATVRLEIRNDPKAAVITFVDRGVPYNPLESKAPDVTLKAKDRKPGGLGIFLSGKMVDNISYEYTDGQNILTIEKRM